MLLPGKTQEQHQHIKLFKVLRMINNPAAYFTLSVNQLNTGFESFPHFAETVFPTYRISFGLVKVYLGIDLIVLLIF